MSAADVRDDEPARVIVAIQPPPLALCTDIARLIMEILTRRTVAELRAVAGNDNQTRG